MTKKWVRLLTALLAVVLVVPLAACTGNDTNPQDGSSTGKPSQSETAPSEGSGEEAVWDPYTPYKETVVITKGVSKPGTEADYTFESNPFSDYVKEKLNIETKVAWEVDPTNYDQKVALSITTKDIPDIMVVNRKIYQQLSCHIGG